MAELRSESNREQKRERKRPACFELTREQRLIELVKQITEEDLIGDDCAVLPGQLLVSSDMLVEGKHFLLPQMTYEDIGWKSMAANLSDIAAMAAEPDYAVVNIAMPETLSDEDFAGLYSGLRDCAARYGCRIVGGDLTGSNLLVVSITVLGHPYGNTALMRSTAKPGDIVAASGDFGASALGLNLILQGEKADACASYPLKRHLRPEPRLKQAQQLAEFCAASSPALMDTSDGLADALLQIGAASGVSIEVDAERIPIHAEIIDGARKMGLDPLELALYGGEDYELLSCMNSQTWQKLQAADCDFKAIGRVTPGENVFLARSGSATIKIENRKTYQHWQRS